MANKSIKVVVVAADGRSLSELLNLLEPHKGIVVTGSATDSNTGWAEIQRREPDLVIADLDLEPLGGIELTQRISSEFRGLPTILTAKQAGLGYFKEAMRVGAGDFLVRPISPDELGSSIEAVYQLRVARHRSRESKSAAPTGEIVTVCSAKGGVGKTFVATNLAALMARRFSGKVALLDLSLQYGGVNMALDLPSKPTVMRLGAIAQELKPGAVDSVLHHTPYGLRVLLAPEALEDGDKFTSNEIASLAVFFKRHYPLTIIDTATAVNDVLLMAIQESSRILMVTTPELPALTNTGKLMELLNRLEHDRRARIVLNRQGKLGLSSEQVARSLGHEIFAELPDDPRTATNMVNQGKLVVQASKTDLAGGVRTLASKLLSQLSSPELRNGSAEDPADRKQAGLAGRLLNRR